MLQLLRVFEIRYINSVRQLTGLRIDILKGCVLRKTKCRLHNSQQIFISQNIIDVGYVWSILLKIQCQIQSRILLALICIECLVDIFVHHVSRRRGRCRRAGPIRHKIECLREGENIWIVQGVGKIACASSALLKDLKHEILPITYHIPKSKGRHRIRKQAVIIYEIACTLHVADVGVVVGRRQLNTGLRFGEVLIRAQIIRHQQIRT